VYLTDITHLTSYLVLEITPYTKCFCEQFNHAVYFASSRYECLCPVKHWLHLQVIGGAGITNVMIPIEGLNRCAVDPGVATLS